MNTFKDFLVGLLVIILSLIILGIVFLTWPLLVGISSILLMILAVILFFVLIFYVIALIGYITRKLFAK
ncbi:MAG: hypothetical protein ABIA77_02325 [Candidatus Omnitrophota bacterium]